MFDTLPERLKLRSDGVGGVDVIGLFAVDADDPSRDADHGGILGDLPEHHGIGGHTGIISNFNTGIDVTYNSDTVETEAETEAETAPVDPQPESSQTGTIVAVVILVAVIAGIVVLAVFMMRSDKKISKNSKGSASEKNKK